MVASTAICIQGTVTGIFAFLLSAGQGVRTVRVSEALIRPAVLIGVALVIVWTIAHSPVVSSSAEGIDATLLKEARILALPADASLVIGALKVTLAPSYNAKGKKTRSACTIP